jgi:hypothetical protein
MRSGTLLPTDLPLLPDIIACKTKRAGYGGPIAMHRQLDRVTRRARDDVVALNRSSWPAVAR